MELFRNLTGPIITELWFEMFCYLINVEKIDILNKKRPTDSNPNYFWIIPAHDWSKTSPANAVCLLGTLKNSNVLDIDISLVKNSKIDAAFLIINK